MKLVDLTNKKFGKLTVIDRAPNKNNWTMWNCVCECGNTLVCYSTHLIRNNTKSCGCSMITRGASHIQWTGCGEISGNIWSSIRRNGKSDSTTKRKVRKGRENLPFDIDIEYIWDLFLKQNRKCSLSGVDIYFRGKSSRDITASLDRIDNSLGYIKGNVQWVHKDVNKMKNVFTQEYFLDMCKKIAQQHS
jgi:hypothetical protein